MLILLAAVLPAAATPGVQEKRDLPAFLGPLPRPPEPKDNPTTPAKVELGRMLYCEPRISGSGVTVARRPHSL